MILAITKTFLVLIIGTFSGYFFQKFTKKRKWLNSETLKKIAIFLQKLGMIWFISITYIGSLWILKMENFTRIISLAVVGAISIVAGGVFAVIISKVKHYDSIKTGSMFCCGFFANTASIGGMICFYFLGEEGYALVPIFTFFMRFLYYGVGYPIANMYSENFIKDRRVSHRIIEIIKDPFFYTGIGSVVIGLFFNLSNLDRPAIYTSVNEILIPFTTFMLLFSIGLNLKLSRISKYLQECLYISLIRFLVLPLAILTIALLLNYQAIDHGLPLKVSLIQAAMPVAFNSVVAANVYNLDVDLVNSCWIFTTIGVVFILPLLFWFINLF